MRNNLKGLRALVTSGPTHEALDAVRFLGNYSSGKQGHAIAAALASAGADVTLISGPVAIPAPEGVRVVSVVSAREMLAACKAALPVDIACCAAAVADFRPKRVATQKIKKNGEGLLLELVENPDILHTLSHARARPKLVIGFAAETHKVEKNAREKLKRKGCDWLVANDVSGGKAFHAEENQVIILREGVTIRWPRMSKIAIAEKLVQQIQEFL